MTEKEKAKRGLLYNASNDNELINERFKVKDLCFKFNNTLPSDMETKYALLEQILPNVHTKPFIEQPFLCDYGYNIEMGENFYSNHNLVILDTTTVKFGDNVMLGPNCGLYTAGHPENVEIRNSGLEYAKPITIGNNVWIGGNVVILPGVTIGDNSIIGAGSVVTKDIPSNVIAVGNPCTVKRKIAM